MRSRFLCCKSSNKLTGGLFIFEFLHGGLLGGSAYSRGRAYSRSSLKSFSGSWSITLEIVLPVCYVFMLDMQAIGCFLKDMRCFVD